MMTSAEDRRIPQIKDGEHGPTCKDYTKTAEWGVIKLLVLEDIDRVILHLEINPVIVPEVGQRIN